MIPFSIWLFFGLPLNFTKQENFSPVQIESICRRQNQCESKVEFDFGWLENNVFQRLSL